MELCFATNNVHKLQELQQLIGNTIAIKSLKDIGCYTEIPETGNTLKANSLEKAAYIKQKFNINCFADDTGLEVEALNGEPGIYSARYAGEPPNPNNNIKLLLQKIKNKSNRRAQFRTVIALLLQNAPSVFFEGIVKGHIITTPKGKKGFGYDPVFVPSGFNCTFAEMTPSEKNNHSHRGKAVIKLANYLKYYKTHIK